MSIESYLQDQRQTFEADLFRLLAIPSVSTDPARAKEVARCAEEVAAQMRQAGLERVEILPTEGHPVVVASGKMVPGRPTVLIYGHYDVQPEDPVDLWTSPPFEPTVRDGKVWARGATDDKGQFLTHIKAVQALLKTHGDTPVNVKFVIEGEEEIGSKHLSDFLVKNRERLAADLLVISDSAMFSPGQPSLVYGLRGLAYVQIDVKGADSDLHSGVFGGAVPNPGFELARIVAQLKDEKGAVQVKGFYDRVRPLSPEERADYAALPFDPEAFRAEVGVAGLDGEEGYTPLEQRTARPTLEVNGMLCGWTGPGAKTVLPARAMAKISCRLVPDQDPDEIAQLLVEQIQALAPAYVDVTVTPLHGGKPWITPREHPALAAAGRALERVFGKKPVFVREGGSIPIVVEFQNLLGVPGVLLGFGLNTENLHAPNEHFELENYHKGIRTSIELLRELAALPALV